VLSGLPAGTWTINPGAVSGTGASTTIPGLSPGTYNFTVTNPAGCTSATSASVVINTQPPIPTAPIVGTITQPICTVATGSVVLSGLPAGTWTINPGAITGTGTSRAITGISAGTYNYTVTNSAGCTSAASANVVINAKPNCVPVAVNDTTTSPQDTQIKITVTTNDFDPDGTIDVTTVDLNPSTPGTQKEFTVPGQGTYTVDNTGVVTVTPVSGYCGIVTPVGYTVHDNSGATSNVATINISITCVNHPPVIDLPDVRTSGNTPVTICSPISDPDVGDTFTSSICGAPKHGSVTTAISADGKNVCAVYTADTGFTGKDSICVTVCDQKGLCGSSTSVITVTLIRLELTPKAVTCTGSKDGLIGLTVIGGTAPFTFVWTGPGSFTATTEDISGLAGGSYSVKVTDAIGEIKTASATVSESGVLLNLNATPKAATQKESVDGSVTLEIIGGSVELVVTGGTIPFIYDWTGPDNFTATTEDLSNVLQGTYYVTVTDANSCIKTTSAKVDIQVVLAEDDNCELFIPNVFTPNGDGVHDYFEIRCLYNYENPEVQIFNRNGNLVFKKDHYGNIDYWGSKDKAYWNGHSENNLNFMGSELPVGTYYYILKLGNGRVHTGFVFLGR
jgi:gliding motility-associated-like protein